MWNWRSISFVSRPGWRGFFICRGYMFIIARWRRAESARFKVMERRLLKQIMIPAMIATWVFGILLVLTPGAVDWGAAWWWTKLLSVILMSGFHGACSKWRKGFLNDANVKSEKFYRVANEVPTVLFLVIVFAVVA